MEISWTFTRGVFKHLLEVGLFWRLGHFFSPKNPPAATDAPKNPRNKYDYATCSDAKYRCNVESKVQSVKVNIASPTLQKSFHFCHVLPIFWISRRFSRKTRVVFVHPDSEPSRIFSSALEGTCDTHLEGPDFPAPGGGNTEEFAPERGELGGCGALYCGIRYNTSVWIKSVALEKVLRSCEKGTPNFICSSRRVRKRK